jgi:flagellar motor component MotA
MKVIYGILGVAMIFMVNALEGGNAHWLRHDAALLLVLGPTFLLTLVHHSERELGATLKAAFGSGPLSRAEGARHAAILSTPRRIAIGLGWVGFGIGMIHVFKHLDTPKKLGAGIAMAFITTLYALVLSEFLFAPLVNRIWSRVENGDVPPTDSGAPPSRKRPLGSQFIFGALGLVFLFLSITLEGGHLPDLVQSTAFLIVVGPAIFLTLAHHSVADTGDAFRAAFESGAIDTNKATRHICVLSTARIITLAAGALALIFGLVHVMQNLSDPTKVGAGLAVAIVAPLYALFIAELFLAPFTHRIRARAAGPDAALDAPAKPSVAMLALSTIGVFYSFPLVLAVL